MPVTDAELAAALRLTLDRPIAAVRRRPWPYSSSVPIEEVVVRGEDGRAPLRLLLKHAREPSASCGRPSFLLDPQREAEAYRVILGPTGIDAPRCHGVVGTGLLLELVDGTPLWQVGELEVWEAAARWLAGLHARPVPARARRLLRYDAAHQRRWLRRASLFTGLKALAGLERRFDELIAPLERWPDGLLHGEFFASNVLVEHHGARARIRPIDWETIGVGPGVLDLAALVAGRWRHEEARRIALAYLGAAATPQAEHELALALDHARLLVAIQWLGWSPEWTPPVEHRHDWLSEARALIDRLGLG